MTSQDYTGAVETTPQDERVSNALPATSLIICSRNRARLLQESVESVLAGDALPSEILIMDQSAADDPYLSQLPPRRGCEIRYMRVQVVGECPARNEGIRQARHDALVFTDDDVLVEPDWFATIVQALVKAGPYGIVTGQVRPAIAEQRGGFAPSTKVDPVPAQYSGRIGKDVLFPMNMAMFRSAIDTVGFFDERLGAGGLFPGGEDNDIGYRLLEAGYTIWYVPEAILYHRAWRSDRDFLPLRWSYGVARGAFYAKHMRLRDPYIRNRMLYDLKRHVFDFLGHMRGQRRRAAGDVLLNLGMFYGAAKWWVTQRAIPRSRTLLRKGG